MNEVLVFQEEYALDDWVENIQNLIYGQRMKYLASDLLKEGMPIEDLENAIQRAIISFRSAGIETRKHFIPLYTEIQGSLVRDCKTTQFGLATILLNGNPKLKMVASWQTKVLNAFLKKYN